LSNAVNTPGWFDFPEDVKAIISAGTSFQLYPSSIYWAQTGFGLLLCEIQKDGFKFKMKILNTVTTSHSQSMTICI